MIPTKKIIPLALMLATSLLLTACGEEPAADKDTYLLQGAWTLRHVSHPYGVENSYTVTGSGTACMVYAGDSAYFECMLATTPSGLVIMPTSQGSVTLIDNGGSEKLYLENGDPHPLTVSGDTLMTIQRDGAQYTYARADNIYKEWGQDICDIVAREQSADGEGTHNRYVLSAKERRQQQQIRWFGFFSIVVALMALLAAHLAVTNWRARRLLQLQLQQIEEVQQNRPQQVRQAVASVERQFFASDDYAALQRRMGSGERLRDDDWRQVEQYLRGVYPGFGSQLRSLHPLSELEYRVCLLVKLRIAPKDIAQVLARDVSTISTVRSRLYQKVFGHKGGAKEWDDFVLSIG